MGTLLNVTIRDSSSLFEALNKGELEQKTAVLPFVNGVQTSAVLQVVPPVCHRKFAIT